MLFVVSACSEAETERIVDLSFGDAHALYVDAVSAITAADSFAGHITLFGSSFMMGIDRESDITIGIRHIFGEGDNFQAEIDATHTQADFISYFRDGTFYYYGYHDFYRFSMPGEDFLRMTLSMLVTQVLFSEEYIFYTEVVEDSYGTAIRFEVSQSGMTAVLRQLADFKDTGGVIIHSEDDVSYIFDDVVVLVRIGPDGDLRRIRLSFRYLATHHHISEDAVVSVYQEIGMNVSQLGGVTIDFPDYLHTFPNLDEN